MTAANVHLKDGQSNGGTLAEYLSEPVTVCLDAKFLIRNENLPKI